MKKLLFVFLIGIVALGSISAKGNQETAAGDSAEKSVLTIQGSGRVAVTKGHNS